MSIMFDKLKLIIDKNIYECNKNIYILKDNNKEIIDNLLKTYPNAKISNFNDDYDTSCLILIQFKTNTIKDHNLLSFINEYLKKNKIFVLIVPMDFDFSYVYNHTVANSLDTINWKNNNDAYFIVLKKY